MIVPPNPAGTGQTIAPGYDLGPVWPMTVRRIPFPVKHFVAIGCSDQWPFVPGAPQNNY